MKEEDKGTYVELSSRERKKLRGLAHHLDPAVYVGKEGLSDALIASLMASLTAHELVKVKLGQNCPLGKKMAAELLSQKTNSALVQLIGKMVILYKENKKLDREKRV